MWSPFIIALSLLLLTGIAAAQEPISITVGENQVGTFADASTTIRYRISSATPLSILVQVLAISQGLAPTFQVLDPGGVVVVDAGNPGTQTTAQSAVNLASPGDYTIEVTSANGTTGQFLISIQPGQPLAPPEPLVAGQPVTSTVDAQTTRRAYGFSGLPDDVLVLTVRTDAPEAGFVTVLRDAESDETLSLNAAGLLGIRYRLPATERSYVLEVMHGGGDAPDTFTVCLATESGSAVCPGEATGQDAQPTIIPPVETVEVVAPTTNAPPTINPLGACQVTPRAQTINVRSGPGTNFGILTQMPLNTFAPVIGRLADNSWFQVNVNGIIGWVSATVVTLGGNCAGVSVVVPPTAPPPPPTVVPPVETVEVVTGTPTVTLTPSVTPTPNPTNVPGTLTIPLTRIFQITFVAPLDLFPLSQELDYTASPAYGQANLSAGFSPDPYSVGMTAGGNVDVSYLGGSCSGFATTAPSLRVNYGGGGGSLLRFYFVASGGSDSTIVINDPYGNFYCVDDSFGTVNPTIDFNNPAGGSYDLWIASYASGSTVSGTFYITGNSGNHP